SPATALVTMIRLLRADGLPVALLMLLISGRLTTRNSSATCERGASGVTRFAAARAARSKSTRCDVAAVAISLSAAGATTGCFAPSVAGRAAGDSAGPVRDADT